MRKQLKRSKEVVYQSAASAAAQWGVSTQRVNVWLRDGRISGAVREENRLGRVAWLIPIDAERPAPAKPHAAKIVAK